MRELKYALTTMKTTVAYQSVVHDRLSCIGGDEQGHSSLVFVGTDLSISSVV